MLLRLGRTFAGMLLGIFALVLPWPLFYVILPWKMLNSQGGGTLLAIGATVWIPGLLILGLILQGSLFAILRRRKNEDVAAGIWLLYPTALLLVVAFFGQREFGRLILAGVDYDSRHLTLPTKPASRILLVMSDRSADAGGFQEGGCWIGCISALRSGGLDSLAIPHKEVEGEYEVFRLERGGRCVDAVDNAQQYTEVSWKLERALSNVRNGKRELDRAPLIREAQLRLLRLPRANKVGPTSMLAESGYFGQCITATFEDHYAYDAKINYGRSFARMYGPCCNVAEIFEPDSRGDKLIARWEEGDGLYSHGEPFTISDIMTKLTGKSFGEDVTPYKTLAHFPVDSVDSELMRLAALNKAGAYIHSWETMATWIREVLSEEMRRKNVKRIGLSKENVAHLIQIAPNSPLNVRKKFFERIGAFLDEETITRLKIAEDIDYPTAK